MYYPIVSSSFAHFLSDTATTIIIIIMYINYLVGLFDKNDSFVID